MNPIQHIKKCILNGALAIIPLALVYIILRFLYVSVDRTILNLIDNVVGFRIPGMGIIIVLLILYFLGLFAGNLIGKWFFSKIEWLTGKIPLIRTTYQVGKQLSSSLSLPEKKVFKKVVLVNYLKADMYTIGFVTGKVTTDNWGHVLLKIFVPTPPNPMSGTMVFVPEDQVLDPGWTIDEGIRTVISAGIIGPEQLSTQPLKDPARAPHPQVP